MRLRSSASGGLLLLASVSSAITGAGAAPSRPAELLIPAYFYPTAGPEWDRLRSAARSVPLTAILNPASGPGRVADPNYVAAADRLRAAGGRIVAYVHTSYGERGLNAVEADIARYQQFYKVDGFFIDEVSNDPGLISYYSSIYRFIKNVNTNFSVIGNPGTAIPEAYLTAPAADTMVTFEGAGGSYATATPPPFPRDYPASRFANIVHGVKTPGAMLETLSLAASRNVGMIYVTDLANLSNPYSGLPTYFDREVAALRAAPSFLEPALVTLAVALSTLYAARRLIRRRRMG